MTPFNNKRWKKAWNLTPKEKINVSWKMTKSNYHFRLLQGVKCKLAIVVISQYMILPPLPPNCKTKKSKRCDFCRQASKENHDNGLAIVGFCQYQASPQLPLPKMTNLYPFSHVKTIDLPYHRTQEAAAGCNASTS